MFISFKSEYNSLKNSDNDINAVNQNIVQNLSLNGQDVLLQKYYIKKKK